MYKIIDLFCGTGGFSKGFENCQSGQFQVILGIDILKDAIGTFRANHSKAVAFHADITKVKKSLIVSDLGILPGQIDVIVGGPPCQGFSSIRPHRSTNEDDPRNNLYQAFASFVEFFKPKIFVMENVVGLATHKGGLTIADMQETFFSLGYVTDWRILNAANYGIPQKRERLIIIGTEQGGQCRFPMPTHHFNGKTIGYKDKTKMIHVEKSLFQNEIPDSITVKDAIADLPELASGHSCSVFDKKPITPYQSARRKKCKTLTLHQSTQHTAEMLKIISQAGHSISALPRGTVSSGFSTSYSRLSYDEPSVTLTVNFVHPASNRCIHPIQDRALTPREGARLQSFDDDYIFVGNRSQIVKQIGNAVPPLLGKAIAEEIAKVL